MPSCLLGRGASRLRAAQPFNSASHLGASLLLGAILNGESSLLGASPLGVRVCIAF